MGGISGPGVAGPGGVMSGPGGMGGGGMATQPGWGGVGMTAGPPAVGDNMNNYPLMDPEETAVVSLTRKYGYAIMLLSVVVLAAIVVST